MCADFRRVPRRGWCHTLCIQASVLNCPPQIKRQNFCRVFVAILRVAACCGSALHTASPAGCRPRLPCLLARAPSCPVFVLDVLLSELVELPGKAPVCLSQYFLSHRRAHNWSVLSSPFRNPLISCQPRTCLDSLDCGRLPVISSSAMMFPTQGKDLSVFRASAMCQALWWLGRMCHFVSFRQQC